MHSNNYSCKRGDGQYGRLYADVLQLVLVPTDLGVASVCHALQLR